MPNKKNNCVTCIATFIAKNDAKEELYNALTSLLEPTRQESGCINYELYQSTENEHKFIMLEKFADMNALKFHSEQSYLIEFKKSLQKLIVSVDIAKCFYIDV